jgi:hypothetical protein
MRIVHRGGVGKPPAMPFWAKFVRTELSSFSVASSLSDEEAGNVLSPL